MRRRILGISSSPMELDVDIDSGGNINARFLTDWYEGHVKFSLSGSLLGSSLATNTLIDDFIRSSIHRQIRDILVRNGYLAT